MPRARQHPGFFRASSPLAHHHLLLVGAQADLRQYVNDLLLKTGGVAAPGNPVITCKLYPVRRSVEYPMPLLPGTRAL